MNLRERIVKALTDEHYRRAKERIVASPEQHCSAMADIVLAVVRPATCPWCAGPVYYDFDCHTWSDSSGKWMACLGCDSAVRYECQHGECGWGYVDGFNPNNPRSAGNESRRPAWLADWELFGPPPMNLPQAYPGVLFVMDADLGDD